MSGRNKSKRDHDKSQRIKNPKTLLEACNNRTDVLDALLLSLKKGEGLMLSNDGQVVKFLVRRTMPKGGNYGHK